MKCSKNRCPIQFNSMEEECRLGKEECPYFTEEIDANIILESLCDHIANLVVQKLKKHQGDN